MNELLLVIFGSIIISELIIFSLLVLIKIRRLNSQQKPERSVEDKTQHFSTDCHSADDINEEIKEYLLEKRDELTLTGKQVKEFQKCNFDWGFQKGKLEVIDKLKKKFKSNITVISKREFLNELEQLQKEILGEEK